MLQWDHMHTFVVHGVWNIECGASVGKLKQEGVQQSDLHAFLTSFVWPSQVGDKINVSNIFRKKLRQHRPQIAKEESAFSCDPHLAPRTFRPAPCARHPGPCTLQWLPAPAPCSSSLTLHLAACWHLAAVPCSLQRHLAPSSGTLAGDALAAYSVIRLFLLPYPRLAEVKSYVALAEVMDTLEACKRDQRLPQDLHAAIQKFCKLHQRVYGARLWVPNHHYMQRLPQMYAQHKKIVGCYVHERKHRVAKRFSENMRRVGEYFDISVLKMCLAPTSLICARRHGFS